MQPANDHMSSGRSIYECMHLADVVGKYVQAQHQRKKNQGIETRKRGQASHRKSRCQLHMNGETQQAA